MKNSIDIAQTRRPLSLDGVGSNAAGSRAAYAQTATAQLPRRRVFYAPRPARPERKFPQKLQLSLMLMTGACGGFFADNLMLGLALLALYAVFALVTHIASRTTFTLALLLLAAISILLLVKPNMVLIGNFTTYAFILLLIGSITMTLEARLPKRMARKYRR